MFLITSVDSFNFLSSFNEFHNHCDVFFGTKFMPFKFGKNYGRGPQLKENNV